MTCLRSKSVAKLSAAQNSKRLNVSLPYSFFGFSRHTDGDILPYSQAQLIKDGMFAKVPYITGTQDERTVLGLALMIADTVSKWTATLSIIFSADPTSAVINDTL